LPTCPEKRNLIRAYAAALHDLNRASREHADAVTQGLHRDLLTTMKGRIQESRERCDEAQKLYLDHFCQYESDALDLGSAEME
jgi:hypothetical protein